MSRARLFCRRTLLLEFFMAASHMDCPTWAQLADVSARAQALRSRAEVSRRKS